MALVKRLVKGAPLTAQEHDGNIDFLDNKIQGHIDESNNQNQYHLDAQQVQDLADANTHVADQTIHVTTQDKINWNNKINKTQVTGNANRRFVINADGSVTVAPELGVLQNVTFVDSADADTKKDSLEFTFVGGNTIQVNINELFDIGAFNGASKNTTLGVVDFVTLGGTTVQLDLTSWFDTKIDKPTTATPNPLKFLNEEGNYEFPTPNINYITSSITLSAIHNNSIIIIVRTLAISVNPINIHIPLTGLPDNFTCAIKAKPACEGLITYAVGVNVIGNNLQIASEDSVAIIKSKYTDIDNNNALVEEYLIER